MNDEVSRRLMEEHERYEEGEGKQMSDELHERRCTEHLYGEVEPGLVQVTVTPFRSRYCWNGKQEILSRGPWH